ncbi:acyl-CoA dehydrogenase family protein [Streptomyces sp. NPDC053367]|uniref:acyl-CoA dehydrogenase family protein n=1 Tax=Streptomyces sp. NPDC053367 TaxID=3365700 RepID=UPI0037D475F6
MTTTAHPLVARARRIAEGLLTPQAALVDEEGVPAGHIAAIKESGLLGVTAPKAYGGWGAPAAVARETAEILAGACCSTWFVQTQHHTPVQLLAASEAPVRERLLRRLATGELMAGIAYAHVRAFPRRPVTAVREGDVWRFDGTVPWYTGWGLNDVLLLAGATETGDVVFAFAEAREQPGLRPSAPLRLAALSAARTVALDLDGLRLPADDVVLRTPYERFAVLDRAKAARTNPAVLGVAGAALDLLDEETAGPLRARLAEVRREAYELAGHPVPGERLEEKLAVRTRAQELLRAATTAAVVAGGGRAILRDSRAQRLAREALFLLVQGQTADSRSAHLRALTG